MKVFHVISDICHWDATPQFPSLAATVGCFPETDLFVEAPDYVFEGWGYQGGDFIKPEPPEGWLYDDATGTFYPQGENPPGTELTVWDELDAAYQEGVNTAYDQ